MSKFNSKTVKALVSDLTLIVDPQHPRFDPRSIGPLSPEMIQSISSRGIVQPVIISEDGEILDGRNRYRCAIEVGLNEVPVRVVSESKIGIADDIDAVLASHELNAQRVAVDPMQQARDAQRALAAGKTKESVAQAMGIPVSRLDALLKLATQATKATQAAVEQGAISVTAAEYLAPLAPAQQASVLAAAQKLASDAAAVKGKAAKTTAGGAIVASNIDIRRALAESKGETLPESAQRKSDDATQTGPRKGAPKKDELEAVKAAIGALFGKPLSDEEKKAMQFAFSALAFVVDGTMPGDSLKQRFPSLCAALTKMR